MKDLLNKLKNIWELNGNVPISKTKESEIQIFQIQKKLVLPEDLSQYFKLLNGSNGCDLRMFEYYPFIHFKNVHEHLGNWNGIPDYSNIINTLPDSDMYFVFADYMFHMFTYAIKLNNGGTENNEVIIISGDKFKIIANSFSEFIELYITDSAKLYFD